ncbi:hypothetical protein [Streptomyces chartreusis]|uniref:hypothetical protein n=1 Tax=Streptomyces chartreusis TaxID=1969 RepID=UPI00364CE130
MHSKLDDLGTLGLDVDDAVQRSRLRPGPAVALRKRDPGNWVPTAKRSVDGLVTDAGLLPDDNQEFLVGPIPFMGESVTTGCTRMSIGILELAGLLTGGNVETVTGMAG